MELVCHDPMSVGPLAFNVYVGNTEPTNEATLQTNALCTSVTSSALSGDYITCNQLLYGRYIALQHTIVGADMVVCEVEPAGMWHHAW